MNVEASEKLELRYADLNAGLNDPQIIAIKNKCLPDEWARFCERYRVRLYIAILYDNPAETGKLYPATSIAVRGVSRGDHEGAEIAIDSTSGGYALAWAEVLKQYESLEPDFPIKSFIAVVPRSLPEGKREMLADAGIKLVDAESAVEAMELAQHLAKEHGYWYTRQYWNSDNSYGYKRVAEYIAEKVPTLGMVAWGVGSGGGCSGVMPVFTRQFKDRTKLSFRRIAVVVADGQKVGGVRDELSLEPGSLEWRLPIDGVRFIGENESYRFSSALWRQSPFIGGPSTGFAAEGAMLAARELRVMRRLDDFRAPDGLVHILVPSLDTRKPYLLEYKQKGVYLDDTSWN